MGTWRSPWTAECLWWPWAGPPTWSVLAWSRGTRWSAAPPERRWGFMSDDKRSKKTNYTYKATYLPREGKWRMWNEQRGMFAGPRYDTEQACQAAIDRKKR